MHRSSSPARRRRARIHKQVALPTEHGSWAFYLAPLFMGIAAGGRITHVTAYLVVATLCGFLIRQPVTTLVKVRSGRKPKDYARPAWFWLVLYAAVGGLHVLGLVLRGFGFLLVLAVPGVLILCWHLALIARRQERRQLAVELVGAAFLSLSAPAALWVAERRADLHTGGVIGLLALGFSAWLIFQSYVRLAQRSGEPRVRDVRCATALALGAFGVALVAAVGGVLPPLVPLACGVPVGATLWARMHPAPGRRPRAIGMEMLAITVVFTALFVAAYTY